MDLGLSGKTALITGGSHGIGRSIAFALAKEGCSVAICARNIERVNTVVGELRSLGTDAVGVQSDVTNPDDIARVVAEIDRKWGTLHILINNVGGGGRWGKPCVVETDDQIWWEVYSKNAMAAVRFTKMAIPYMRKQKWGRVVTITSVYGREGGGRPWFNMAKTAQTSLMKTLALNHDLVRDGITFNSVAPGAIAIPGTGWDEERLKDPVAFDKMVRENYPLGRFGTPEEVADLVVFLCSERASLVNGASVAVDGAESRSF
jgi:3-oxoacyl-[acyl-carrier protein] reductase